MPRPFRPLKSHTVDGHPIYYQPRIRPFGRPRDLRGYMRANDPRMFRLILQVHALEQHNRRVIEMRMHTDAQREFARERVSLAMSKANSQNSIIMTTP